MHDVRPCGRKAPRLVIGFREEGKTMKAIEFIDIHQHDEDEKCECIILPDGNVDEPVPSHINRLIEITGRDSAWLHAQMEKGMEPLYWLVQFSGCMSVWATRVVSPAEPTQAQLDALEELHDSAMLASKYLMQKADESYVESVRRAKAQK